MDKNKLKSIEFQIEELKLIYENLQNALSAQKNTFHIFALITTAVIAALGTVLTSSNNNNCDIEHGFIPIILCIIFPLISYCFCGIWLGEVKRMLRSGNYIALKSDIIKEKCGKDFWELENYNNSLGHEDFWEFENYNNSLGQIKVPYILHLLYFIGCAILSYIAGALFICENLRELFTNAEGIVWLCGWGFNILAIAFCFIYCYNALKETLEYRTTKIHVLNCPHSKYAICIPVTNEGLRLKRQLLKMMELGLYKKADIIICDGNSVDGSTDIDFLRKVKVFALIKYPRAHQSEQLLEGFKFVLKHQYRGLITVDGNGKDSVEDIEQFIHELNNGVDFIQGSRYCKGGLAVNTPFVRTLAIKYHVHRINKITNSKFTDTTNGFRAFNTKIILDHKDLLFTEGKYSNHAMVYHLFTIATKYIHKEIPVKREYPRNGRATKIVPVWGHIELLSILHNLKKQKYGSSE